MYPERLADQVEQLTHHALRGRVWAKAVAYCRQAGANALAHSAYREAVTYLEQALMALQHLPERRDTMAQAIDLRFDLRHALDPMGELDRVRDRLQEAKALAKRLSDQARLGKALAYLTDYCRLVSDYDRAVEFGQCALTMADRLRDAALRDEMHYRLGQVYYTLGDYRRALGLFGKTVAALEGHLSAKRLGPSGLLSVFPRTWLLWGNAELGEFAAGNAGGEEAVRAAAAADHPHGLIAAYHGVGRLSLRKGDLPQAVPMLERGLELSRVWNVLSRGHQIASDLGVAYALSGRVTEALPLLEQAVERGTAIRAVYHALWVVGLSEAYRLSGRIEEAMQLARRALEHAREHRERGHQAYALRLLGEIAVQRDPPAVGSAEEHYRQALALAEQLGMRPLVAHCHMGLGTLYLKIGRREEATAELSTAIERYRAMEMMFWLPQAEAALAEVKGG